MPAIVVIELGEDLRHDLNMLRAVRGIAAGPALFAAVTARHCGNVEAAARQCGAAVVLSVLESVDPLEQEIHAALRRSHRGLEELPAIRRGAARDRLNSTGERWRSVRPWTTSYLSVAPALRMMPQGSRFRFSDDRCDGLGNTGLGDDNNV